jgi:hypothetical protein
VTRHVVEDEDVISSQHVMKRGHAAIQVANQRASCQIANHGHVCCRVLLTLP